MKNGVFTLILSLSLSFLLQSCNKKDPNPELTDSIYIDLKQEYELSKKQEEDVQKQLEKDVAVFRGTKPQTGMHNVNRGKMSTTKNLLTVVEQQKKFFEIKMEQRKIYVQERYLESFRSNGRPWPDEKETADYKLRMKLQREKFANDVANVPRGTSDKKDPKEPKDAAKPAESKPAH